MQLNDMINGKVFKLSLFVLPNLFHIIVDDSFINRKKCTKNIESTKYKHYICS